MRAGDFATAERACVRALEREPEKAEAHFLAGVCALEQERPVDALPRFERATGLDPERADYWAQQARCLALLRRHGEALAGCRRAAALSVPDALTHDTLGNVLSRIGQHAEAARQFEAAVALQPRDPQYLYNLASTLMFCGELAAAEAAYEHLLELDPDQPRAHLALADLLEGPPPPGRIERLEAALVRAAGDVDRELIIRQALARTLEAAGETGAAFAHWEEAKSAKKSAVGYKIEDDRAIFSAFETLFDAAAMVDPRPGNPSRAPIFVVGLPRSGTTLAERILGSHSAVASGGELHYFPFGIKEAGASRAGGLIDVDSLGRALAADPAAIGSRYLERARTVVGSAEHFIDKLPLNFFFVGFIRRSLPGARIVCLRRDAMDVCLANFRQLFAVNFPYYRYALSLTDTAEYFVLFEKLMQHWHELMPGAIYDLCYERLVFDTETEVRRLLDYLELDFEPDMLSFHRNAAPVATASAVQVRRPINRSSVGAWRRYADELKPLRRRLEDLGIEVIDPG
jgi:Flp pilus assembly protein TadD